jgi:Protein of unknown function (DUF3089)
VARKFLYLIAFCIVVYLAGRMALQFFPEQLSRTAFVPGGKFEPQAPVPANAYADPAMWISRPDSGAGDPARWLPEGVKPDATPLNAAVFFIHPTSYLARSHWNGAIGDSESRRLADMLVRGLASPFNGARQLWAPRYRQATFGAFLSDAPEARQALDMAYGDIALAFDQFTASIGPDMPIVLAGHSQGSFHLRRLLQEKAAGKPIARRIAAVYAIGWPMSLDHDLPLMGLPACARPQQSGCVVSWLSFAQPADPGMMVRAYARRPGLDGKPLASSPFLCSNPLTGGIGGAAPASANLGTLVPNLQMTTGRLAAAMVPARCGGDGLLDIGAPPSLGPYVLPGNNYHVYDIPLFWANIRADAARRVAAWKP